MLYPYSFGIMIKEIFQATIFYTIDHYHRMDKNVVFEGRVVFGGHIPVIKAKIFNFGGVWGQITIFGHFGRGSLPLTLFDQKLPSDIG